MRTTQTSPMALVGVFLPRPAVRSAPGGGMYRERREGKMFQTLSVIRPQPWVLIGLVLLSLFGWYMLALDQGWLLSWFQGAQAFDPISFTNWCMTRDTRRASPATRRRVAVDPSQ